MQNAHRSGAIALLGLAAALSLALGATSSGARGVVLGLLIPAACAFTIAALTDLLVALLVAAVSAFIGIQVALRVGGNLDPDVDAINFMPFVSAVAVAGGAAVGAVFGALFAARDRH